MAEIKEGDIYSSKYNDHLLIAENNLNIQGRVHGVTLTKHNAEIKALNLRIFEDDGKLVRLREEIEKKDAALKEAERIVLEREREFVKKDEEIASLRAEVEDLKKWIRAGNVEGKKEAMNDGFI